MNGSIIFTIILHASFLTAARYDVVPSRFQKSSNLKTTPTQVDSNSVEVKEKTARPTPAYHKNSNSQEGTTYNSKSASTNFKKKLQNKEEGGGGFQVVVFGEPKKFSSTYDFMPYFVPPTLAFLAPQVIPIEIKKQKEADS